MKTLRKWLLYTVVIIGALLCGVAHASTAAADQSPCDCPDGAPDTAPDTKVAPGESGKAPYAPMEPVAGERTTSATSPAALADSTSPAIPPANTSMARNIPARPGPAPGNSAIVMIELVDR